MTLAKARAVEMERQAIWRAADEAPRAADCVARQSLDVTRWGLDQALGRGTITREQWDGAMERAWQRYDEDMSSARAAFDAVADLLWPEERRAAKMAAGMLDEEERR